MSLTDELKAPFPASKVSWRVGSTTQDKKKGMALAYIDARDVMERLDAVLGMENWQDRYEVHGAKTICYLSVFLENNGPQDPASEQSWGRWVTKADAAGDSAVEAEKGAISDAFKRAAVKWGIGRYLYDIESPWVELDDYKRIKASEHKRLEALLNNSRVKSPSENLQNDTPPLSTPEGAACSWVEAYLETRAQFQDEEALDKKNAEAIQRALKYPKAKQMLVEAGVTFNGA